MKILIYECKKILNRKLLLLLIPFTFLFYNMFMDVTIHPEDSASCEAQNELAAILKEEYGTNLTFDNWGALEKIRLEQIKELDALVKESSILQEASITSYEQLGSIDSDRLSDAVNQEQSRILFGDGISQVFLKQHIEGLYERMEIHPMLGVERGKEVESAALFLRYNVGEEYSEAAVKRVASVISENKLSLLPDSVLFHLEKDFPKLGILLMISCLILILPYQIKEKLTGVNPLFATTKTGRRLWKKRYCAALISCFIVCVLQFLAFCVLLRRSGILQYWNYSVNGNGYDYYWFDMNLGTYVILKTALYSLFTLGAAAVFYLVSRISANYVVGTAIGVPITVGLGVSMVFFTGSFLAVTKSIGYNLLRPLGFLVIVLCIAALSVCGLHKRDQRRDIFI